eukprot:TRINITY_DN3146_c0_g2_i4.p1 TRINITY_DN3146_c0_g2~~TRINITY_DN3146_c0_g2_i4.p1  ORF type:complete len:226 (-),score=84.66 TRINITY_DN3146_c0_g2_i4:66-743(-)
MLSESSVEVEASGPAPPIRLNSIIMSGLAQDDDDDDDSSLRLGLFTRSVSAVTPPASSVASDSESQPPLAPLLSRRLSNSLAVVRADADDDQGAVASSSASPLSIISPRQVLPLAESQPVAAAASLAPPPVDYASSRITSLDKLEALEAATQPMPAVTPHSFNYTFLASSSAPDTTSPLGNGPAPTTIRIQSLESSDDDSDEDVGPVNRVKSGMFASIRRPVHDD